MSRVNIAMFLFLGLILAGSVSGCRSTHDDDVLADIMARYGSSTNTESSVSDNVDAPDQPATPPPPPLAVDGSESDGYATGGITIQQDSLLRVTVKEDPNLDGSYLVNDIGAIELGYIGPVILYNKTEKEAEKKIKEVLKTRGAFRNVTVDVQIRRASYDKVKVDGAVGRPGLISIGAGDAISLNDALLRAGGLRASAKGTKIRIIREGLLNAVESSLGGEEYKLVSEDGDPHVPNVDLKNNDVVHVISSQTKAESGIAEKTVLVLGEVKRKGWVRFSGSEPCSLMYLILTKLDGLPRYASAKAIKIIRKDENNKEIEIVVNAEPLLKSGDPDDDVQLQDGDRIIVPARKISLF